MERINGPVLLVTGEDDQVWSAKRFAREPEARRGMVWRAGLLSQMRIGSGAGHRVLLRGSCCPAWDCGRWFAGSGRGVECGLPGLATGSRCPAWDRQRRLTGSGHAPPLGGRVAQRRPRRWFGRACWSCCGCWPPRGSADRAAPPT
ncbi:hypothetical protein ACQP2T_47740 [Nonomuraea sp. CA-143628]|uniref:hypothetical protein n=1 Tax=Nonomuraea sp. CA-143628 TaxID=3239997 RepID=UPI003D927673